MPAGAGMIPGGGDLEDLVASARHASEGGDTAIALQLYDDAIVQLENSPFYLLLAEALRGKGTVLRETGATDSAYSCYVRSLEVSKKADLVGAKAHALNCLAIIAQRRGDLRETEANYQAASILAEEAADHRLLGMIEQNRGVLAAIRGDTTSARELYRRSFAAFEQAADTQAMSWTLNNLGMLLIRTGDYEGARTALERGLALAKSRNDAVVTSVIRLNIAEMWLAAGEPQQARLACERALSDARARGDSMTVAEALTCRAKIERNLGDFDSALATLRMAQYEAGATQDRLLAAEILREMGEIQRARGRMKAARHAWAKAVETFRIAGADGDADALAVRISILHHN